jgi:uncharacterized protein YndB with AHSA1/START domain
MGEAETLKVTPRGDREVVMTRFFDAPRELVFEAMNEPELLKRWLLGPPGWSMVVCEVDLRVGGAYRYGWLHTDGSKLEISGDHREVVPPERIVRTERMSDFPGEAVASLVLTEQGDGTALTLTLSYQSREARDAALASGMERGVAASYDRLAALLASAPRR